MSRKNNKHKNASTVKINKKNISLTAKTENQKKFLKSIRYNKITICHGPPGSGKTRLSVLNGFRDFLRGHYNKLIFTRPCIEAEGERLGHLPGGLNEKISPYMIPIFDFLFEYCSVADLEEYINNNKIMTLPLAYHRGVNFTESFVVLDEAQNTTIGQMKMFLTRLDKKSKIIINGDLGQSDIKERNGLVDAVDRLKDINNIGIIQLNEDDIMRDPLIKEIECKYD